MSQSSQEETHSFPISDDMVASKGDISSSTSGMNIPQDQDVEYLKERNQSLENIRKATFNILEDIAESEKKLQQKTEELRKFQEAADANVDQTVITDPNGIIVYVNHAMEVLTGYSKKEILGKTPALWGRQMSKKFYATLWRTVKIEKQGYSGELTNKRKDGTTYLASLRITPILDDQGEVKFFVSIERDITEERKAQLRIVRHASELEAVNIRIEEQKERAESILRFLKSIGEGVFATDIEGRIIFMNESAEVLSGKMFQSVEKQLAQEIFSFMQEILGEEQKICFTEQTLKKKRVIHFPNKTFLLYGKKKIPVAGTCSLIRDESDAVIGTITVFQDVTKKHELDQMKDSFLSVAAHQLRTPLGSMRWSMEMLLNGDLGRLPKEAKEVVSQIYENSLRMVTLVSDLLDVSRIDQNRGKEEKKATNITLVLQAVIRVMSAEAEKRSVRITLNLPKEPIPVIMVPPKQIYESFANLIANGIKYNRENGQVIVTVELAEEGLLITIADTGIGIPKEDQSKIFAKFFRSSNAIHKETDGSGLGLSVVKSYLEEANAQVWFESEENVGTKFFVQFPITSIKA